MRKINLNGESVSKRVLQLRCKRLSLKCHLKITAYLFWVFVWGMSIESYIPILFTFHILPRNCTNYCVNLSYTRYVALVLLTFCSWLFTSNMNSSIPDFIKWCQEASTEIGKNNFQHNVKSAGNYFCLKTLTKCQEVLPSKVITLTMSAADFWQIWD